MNLFTKLLQSCSSGSRSTQGMSVIGKEEDRHTQKVAWQKKLLLFLGQLSFYRMNVISPLSHHILHQILVLCFCQYFSFPCLSLMHSSGTFLITGFFS